VWAQSRKSRFAFTALAPLVFRYCHRFSLWPGPTIMRLAVGVQDLAENGNMCYLFSLDRI
jgi:hypothetical protein